MRSASANASRARRLLVGGLLGGAAVGAASVAVSAVARGGTGALVACGAAVAVIMFFALGQAVQVWCADFAAPMILVAALLSYLVRVGALGLLMGVVLAAPGPWTAQRPAAVATMIATLAGWLAGEIWAYARLRIPVYDATDSDAR